MASVLTDHVRHFGAASDPTEHVLPAMERLLRYHMRQKSLLSASPIILGYPGIPSWDSPNSFEDIVADCYIFAVLQRVVALRNQLKIKPNVDGLISRNVQNFLLERQRRCDPIGYAVFGNVKAATARAHESAVVVENLNAGKVHNGTILRMDKSRLNAPPVASDAIQEVLATEAEWESVLPFLIQTTEEGQEWMLAFLLRLQTTGVPAVRCGDLIAVIAGRARTELAARHAESAQNLAIEGDDELGAIVRIALPDGGVESRERWERLKMLVPDRIKLMDRQERVRERVARVFTALAQLVEEGGQAAPTQSEVTERTGIPRATLSDDFRLLREIMSELEAKNSDI